MYIYRVNRESESLKKPNQTTTEHFRHLSGESALPLSLTLHIRPIVLRDHVGLHGQQELINLNEQASQQPVSEHNTDMNASQSAAFVGFLPVYKTSLPALVKRGRLHRREEMEIVTLGTEFYHQHRQDEGKTDWAEQQNRFQLQFKKITPNWWALLIFFKISRFKVCEGHDTGSLFQRQTKKQLLFYINCFINHMFILVVFKKLLKWSFL